MNRLVEPSSHFHHSNHIIYLKNNHQQIFTVIFRENEKSVRQKMSAIEKSFKKRRWKKNWPQSNKAAKLLEDAEPQLIKINPKNLIFQLKDRIQNYRLLEKLEDFRKF